MQLSSVHVAVTDMDRALGFYRDLLQREPSQVDERFSIFAFEGADFGLYDPSYDGFDVEFGTNCCPNFEVEDVEAAYGRVEAMGADLVHDSIQEYGEFRTFHLVDTEGNEIEVFEVGKE